MENAAEPRSRVGEVLAGKYHLERLLGSGGMGAVYEALHAFTQRRVAVKLMHPSIARSKVAAERFLREARAPGSIGHEGIVEVLDGGHAEDGSLYLVMEVLHGETLQAALRKKRMRLQEIAPIVLELLDILEAAHAAGFVHRDIKPENVFLEHAGEGEIAVKLLDFGVAGVLEQSAAERSGDPKLTRAGAVLGTPLYMSPEQALGRAVDARADLWSVGALLYQALAGAPPYGGNSFHALVVSISTQDHVPIGALRPDLPPRVHAVVERALRKDPDKRWSSAHEMAGALAAAVEGRSTSHDVNTLIASGPPEDPSVAPRGASPREGLSPGRLTLFGIGAVIVLGALAYLITLGPWSKSNRTERQDDPIAAIRQEPDEPVAAPQPTRQVPEPIAQAAPAHAARELPAEHALGDQGPSVDAPPAPRAAPAPSPPELTPAPSEPVAKGLSSQALTAVLSAAQPSLQRCYESAMVTALTNGEEALPALAFDVSFTIGKEGRVEHAQLGAAQGQAPSSLRSCLQGAIEAMRFPAAGAASEARFPLVFQPSVVGP